MGLLAIWLSFVVVGFDSSTQTPPFEFVFDVIWKIFISWASVAWKIVQWIFLTVFFYLLGITIFCSFFYGLMVERLESMLGLEPGETQSVQFSSQLKDGFKLLGFLLAGHCLILLIHLLPIIGSLLSPIIGFTFQSFCIGMECFDFTLSMRGMGFREKLNYCKHHFGWTAGNGVLTSFLMVIPFLNTCLLTLSIIGATFLHRRDRIRRVFQSVFKNDYENFVCRTSGNHLLHRFNAQKMQSFLRDASSIPQDGELLYIAQKKSGETILFSSAGLRLEVKNEAKEFLETLYRTM